MTEDIKPAFKLTNPDPLIILSNAQRALRKSGAKEKYIAEFLSEATKDDYDHLIKTILEYFEVEDA